jgi:superfamily II DNA or RNA helicase
VNLRPYQQEAKDKVLEGFKTHTKQLVVLPTGAGKTILFAKIAEHYQPGRVLILAHREELVDQAIHKLRQATGIFAQKEKAKHKASLHAQVVVASVQTMERRLAKWPANHFSLVVGDEAHHAISPQWQRCLKHFDPHAHVLGVTATPNRTDKINLGKYFQSIAVEVFLLDLIHLGYLAEIKVKSIPLTIDIRGVKSRAGDFASEGLGDALEPYLASIAAAVANEAAFRKCLAFLPLIATSKKFVEACKAEGLRACHVDGESVDRREIREAFASGEYDVVSNAMLWTEGFDEPTVDCIILLRPTKSAALYSQIVGRGTRISPGKENLLLLDFLWLHEKHNLIHPAHLIAGDDDELAEAMQAKMEDAAGGSYTTQPILDLEGLMTVTQAAREAKLQKDLKESAKKKARVVDAMEFCVSLGSAATAEFEPVNPWEFARPSQAQIDKLTRAGVDVDTVKTTGHASKIIDLILTRQHLGLATPRQVKYLKQFNHPRPETVSQLQASAFLDRVFHHNVKNAAKAA